MDEIAKGKPEVFEQIFKEYPEHKEDHIYLRVLFNASGDYYEF